MVFSRHKDRRAERLGQIADTLVATFPPLRGALPPTVAEKLYQLKQLDRSQALAPASHEPTDH
jgi:hypothetical protein